MKKLLSIAAVGALAACSKSEPPAASPAATPAVTSAVTPAPASSPPPVAAAPGDIAPEQADQVVAQLEKEIDAELASEAE